MTTWHMGEGALRKHSDIFAVQEEIAREISERLHVRLSIDARKPLTRRYTENSKAYQLYLLGRFHLGKRTREAITRAISHFEEAVGRDPGYALAYAGLADGYALSASGADVEQSLDFVARAWAAARKAIDLDQTLVALGDKARALVCLEEACARRCGGLVYLKVDPALDGLRNEDRFQALLRRVGLAP